MTTSWDELPVTLTVREVCQVLRLSRNAVYELVRTNGIPHTHLGRAVRVSRDALRQHIESPHPVSEPTCTVPQFQLARPRTHVTRARGGVTAAGAHGRR
ncbi:MAG: helix-turn-helix domain-containing protein [Alicyclobacillus sp.]|nr:helix-turn-helix domain-containing protein [Alicyclobacillus sp.]